MNAEINVISMPCLHVLKNYSGGLYSWIAKQYGLALARAHDADGKQAAAAAAGSIEELRTELRTNPTTEGYWLDLDRFKT